ncbi:rod shape-determining protein MreD [Amphibiibacter pelophylacis]|uniref:Rod shape-determining protein MreD n=1 Tax=Amphibiibacter pelophylacis TaxID=1799477 RepID=A0ACC6P5F9_9BURK
MARNELLLPASPLFIWVSLVLALVANLVPLGRQPAVPDLFGIVFFFWCLHQPRYVGVALGFVAGIVLDVNAGSILGQHSLCYALLAYLASLVDKRLPLFGLALQSVQVLPLFFIAHVLVGGVRLVSGGTPPGWSFLLAPLFQALLWPLVSWLLLMPQRRPPDRDKNRPL